MVSSITSLYVIWNQFSCSSGLLVLIPVNAITTNHRVLHVSPDWCDNCVVMMWPLWNSTRPSHIYIVAQPTTKRWIGSSWRLEWMDNIFLQKLPMCVSLLDSLHTLDPISDLSFAFTSVALTSYGSPLVLRTLHIRHLILIMLWCCYLVQTLGLNAPLLLLVWLVCCYLKVIEITGRYFMRNISYSNQTDGNSDGKRSGISDAHPSGGVLRACVDARWNTS